jgi:hypothetical protein
MGTHRHTFAGELDIDTRTISSFDFDAMNLEMIFRLPGIRTMPSGAVAAERGRRDFDDLLLKGGPLV